MSVFGEPRKKVRVEPEPYRSELIEPRELPGEVIQAFENSSAGRRKLLKWSRSGPYGYVWPTVTDVRSQFLDNLPEGYTADDARYHIRKADEWFSPSKIEAESPSQTRRMLGLFFTSYFALKIMRQEVPALTNLREQQRWLEENDVFGVQWANPDTVRHFLNVLLWTDHPRLPDGSLNKGPRSNHAERKRMIDAGTFNLLDLATCCDPDWMSRGPEDADALVNRLV